MSQVTRLTVALVILALVLGGCVLISNAMAIDSSDSELTLQTYQAYSRIMAIYRAGGEAPSLVGKLNSALMLIHEAQLRRSEGDQASATRLEDQARTLFQEITDEASVDLANAKQATTLRTSLIIASVPATVAISTSVLYIALWMMRWLKRSRLYGMRIVEKKNKD